jgi:hypothetical protein
MVIVLDPPLVYIFLFGSVGVLFSVHIHMFQNAVLSIYFLSVAVCGRWSFLRGIE